MTTFRGHPVYFDAAGECRYADTHELTAHTWKERPCGHCLRPNRPDEHDACLGELPGVINACCGHGITEQAYVQFTDLSILRGKSAQIHFNQKEETS